MIPRQTLAAESAAHFKSIIDQYRPALEEFESVYRDLHSHPELGCLESRTALIASSHLKSLQFTVHEGIGGHGVAGVLENGPGPTILLRGDMDALPILERTGLAYASKVVMKDTTGVEKPVMHALRP